MDVAGSSAVQAHAQRDIDPHDIDDPRDPHPAGSAAPGATRLPPATRPKQAPPAETHSGSAAAKATAPLSTANRFASTGERGGRVPRGVCGTKEFAPDFFRDDRGGSALLSNAVALSSFDQVDYPITQGHAVPGGCEGALREVMRRIDHAGGDVDRNMRSAVQAMSHDLASSGAANADTLGRINQYQDLKSLLKFKNYRANPSERPAGVARAERVNSLAVILQRQLRPNDMAYLQVNLVSRAGVASQYNHALLVQMQHDGHYAIFDANNGAFEYHDWTHTEGALRAWFDTAFTDTPYRPAPFRMQVYSWDPEHAAAASVPMLPPMPGPDPTPREYDHALYANSAINENGLEIDTSFLKDLARAGVHGAAESMGSYVLLSVAQEPGRDLEYAASMTRQTLVSEQTRDRTVADMNRLHDDYPAASMTDLPNYFRHAGSAHIRGGDALIDDLRVHFRGRYVGDGSIGYQNHLVVIDFSLNSPEGGASSRGAGWSHPVIVQRLDHSYHFDRDRYQLYDSNFGVFQYTDFNQLSRALCRMYSNGYRADGGIGSASTTWFADLHRGELPHGAHAVAITPVGSSPAENATLDQVAIGSGIIAEAEYVPPRDDLPPPPAGERTLSTALVRADLRRSTEILSTSEPWALYRPSRLTPEQVAARGGFTAGQTQLKDVNLGNHDFDLAAHREETDSAGYLGAFATPQAAIERQQLQGANGFIYAVAAAPNMVNVSATLGAHAHNAGDHEFAAMGHIDSTQIIGWWPIRDGQRAPLNLNPSYRYDVFMRTRAAGAQPQLARFPMDSAAWTEPAYRPFVSQVAHDDTRAASLPKQDANLGQAAFYVNSLMKIGKKAVAQDRYQDYRGLTVLHAYGGDVTGSILYTDARDNVYVDSAYVGSAGRKGNTAQFSLGEDGRFHHPYNYARVLRVGGDGYLYLGKLPENRRDLNGVFRFDGTHLVHVEDGKFVTVGLSVWTPFVTAYDAGTRSSWQLTDPYGHPVTPPVSNRNTYWKSEVGTREQLYAFDEDPDSALAQGVTRFVTRVPTDPFVGTFHDFHAREMIHPHDATLQWLDAHNAAWLFRDGFYAWCSGKNELEIRTLGGRVVWRVTMDPRYHAGYYQEIGSKVSSFTVPDSVWKGIRDREDLLSKLPAILKIPVAPTTVRR